MKLILLQHLSGVDGVLSIGDEIDVKSDLQAINFIQKGIAKAKTEKEEKSLMSKVEKLKAGEAKALAESNAILKKGVIQNELNGLYEAVIKKEAELNGEVLSDGELLEAVEALSKRDAVVSKKGGKK